MTGSQWAEKFRRYSADSGPSPGRHRNDKAPYQVEPLDCCTDNTTSEVTLMWSSQVGKTTVVENAIAYRSSENPGPMMMVCARIEDAEDFSKDRLTPMINATPRLQEVFADEKQRSSGSTILKKKIFGGFLKLGGANSPASLAMRSIRDLFMDEKDRYPASAGKEGNPASLAKKRTSNFFNRKIVNISSPGIKNHSEIEKDFLRSDQRDYYIDCPHCKTAIILKHDQMRCADENPDSTVYLCQSCDAIIDESLKPSLMRETGRWIAAKPFEGHAGFRITEMYSPWRRWAEIMKDWIEAKKDSEKLKVFTNTSRCETWEISGEKLDWEKLYARRESYQRGVVPMGGLFLTGAVDVQKNRLEVEVKAWGRGKESWSIEKYVLFGETNHEKVWNDLKEMIDEQYKHQSGAMMPVLKWAVDSGYNTTWVYDFVRKFPSSRVYAVKGMSDMHVMVAPPKTVDVKASGKKAKRSAKVWGIGVDMIKTELYGNLGKQPPDKSSLEEGAKYPSGYCHYPEYEEEWFRQLTAEVLAPRKGKNGSIVHEWVKVDERNEAIDLHTYNRAMANLVGIDRFKDYNWDKLERDLGIDYSVAAPTEKESKPSQAEVPKSSKKKWVVVKGSGFLNR